MPDVLESRAGQGIPENTIIFPVEWPVNAIERADAEVAQAARAIRLHYYRQLSLLRQIPYLALEANGRGGWLTEYSRAYGQCLMAIHQENGTHGSNDMYIELRSGVLIGAGSSKSSYVITASETVQFGGDETWNLASDQEVYTKLAHLSEQDRFNPQGQIDYLQKMIQKPYHNELREVESVLIKKEEYKRKLDQLMAQLSREQVIETLRTQGFVI